MSALRQVVNLLENWAADPKFAVRLAQLLRRNRRAEPQRLAEYKNILVVKPDEIGDVVMSTPFLRELRRNCPQARIVLIVKDGIPRLLSGCPYVDEIIPYDWEVAGRFPNARRLLRILLLTRRELSRRNFDLAIFLRWDADHYQAGQLIALSGAGRRVGYSSEVSEWKRAMNAGLDGCFTETIAQPLLQHEVLQNLGLLRRLGGSVESERLELWIRDEDRAWARQLLSSLGPGKKIALGVGARQAAKRWPLERFRETATQLGAQGFCFVLLGSHEDRRLGEWPASLRALDLRGFTTLDQSSAILEACDLYLGNDTGLKHIAAAWQKQVVEISCHPEGGDPRAWPWPERFQAWGVPSIQLRPKKAIPPCADRCASDDAHCITAVETSAAVQAVRSLQLSLHSAA
jgi:ADP-heptose:LPS heptosyltransferase